MEEPIDIPLNIKIKQEKLSPPPESPKNAEEPEETEDKKNIEPLKTSNQLLEELFSVFNAAPPENLLNDELLISSLLKEKKKKSKKSKKKSKKRSRSKSSIDEENGDSSSEKKSKKRKKHKKSSDSENNNSENELKKINKKIKKEKKLKEVLVKLEESIKKLEVPEIPAEELTKTIETPVEPKPSDKNSTKSGKIVIKSLKNSTIIEESVKLAKEKEIKKSQNKCDGELTDSKSSIDYVSDISLSDEETYQKQKKFKEKQNGKGFYDSYDRDHKSSHKSSRHRSRSKDRDDHYSRYKDHRHRDYDKDHLRRHRSRSRSPRRRSTDRHKIDKKRLLEIARKNAIQMLKSGALPGSQNLAPDIKEKALEKMRYGGKTIEELTDYCRKLSKGESLGDLSSVSDEEDSDHDKDGKSRAFNHPFMVKERLPIVMNIRNAVPIAPKTAEQTKAILLQFPVSSGQQHRLNESEWVPVPPKKPEPPPKKTVTKTVATIPATKPKPTATNFWQEHQVPQTEFTMPDVPPVDTTTATTPVFPDSVESGKLDVSSIITKRLNAMRKLQDNPEDFEAKKLMFNTQKDMSAWATSKFTPGQFTGSTGANILTVKELSSGFQSWAKKDQFTSTTPLSSGMGMHLLQKMGWKPGEGLGKDKTGSLQPLLLEVKLDKKGLVATEENPQNKKKKLNSQPRKTLESKHPVSLLGELAAKRKWGSPDYQVVTESGPGHQKNFLFKVTMNGMCYQPSVVSNNKKEAKANAAKCCLQQMGVLPT